MPTVHRAEPEQIRHGAMERLQFIDARLFWEARINRADIIEAFHVSPAQAAIDLREYQRLAGNGLAYDTRGKTYRTTERFKPVFDLADARSVLNELSGAGDPLMQTLPKLDRPLDASVAARIRRAARDGERLLVDYQSFTSPEPRRRWLAPARLISDGERWHTRAWCYERKEWRDFVLARIGHIHASQEAGALPPDDEWLDIVELSLRPAQNLSRSQKAAVEREFAMTNGRLVIRIPRAMRIYAAHRWGLDHPESRLELA